MHVCCGFQLVDVHGRVIASSGVMCMLGLPAARRPQFIAGDRIVVVSPSAPVPRGSVGVVTKIVITEIDAVLRYQVKMEAGQSFTFFGFEIVLAAPLDHTA